MLRRVVRARSSAVCVTQPTGFFSTPCPATGAARDLSEQLEGPLARAEVRQVQREVRVNDADQRHVREVQALRDHLRADEHVELAASKGAENAGDRATTPHAARISVLRRT